MIAARQHIQDSDPTNFPQYTFVSVWGVEVKAPTRLLIRGSPYWTARVAEHAYVFNTMPASRPRPPIVLADTIPGLGLDYTAYDFLVYVGLLDAEDYLQRSLAAGLGKPKPLHGPLFESFRGTTLPTPSDETLDKAATMAVFFGRGDLVVQIPEGYTARENYTYYCYGRIPPWGTPEPERQYRSSPFSGTNGVPALVSADHPTFSGSFPGSALTPAPVLWTVPLPPETGVILPPIQTGPLPSLSTVIPEFEFARNSSPQFPQRSQSRLSGSAESRFQPYALDGPRLHTASQRTRTAASRDGALTRELGQTTTRQEDDGEFLHDNEQQEQVQNGGQSHVVNGFQDSWQDYGRDRGEESHQPTEEARGAAGKGEDSPEGR